MEGTSYRSKSYAEAAAADNSIFTAWTKKWGIHVRPWYAMDKLKFSFVEVGKAGKGDSFDICMDIIKYGFPCFQKWANDILNGRLERIMAAEAKAGEQYPKHYRYTTGEKGDKSIGIANSRNGGYVINASITKNNKKVFANVPVDMGDLEILAQNFTDSYAARRKALMLIREEAERKESAHYSDPDAGNGRAVIEDAEEVQDTTGAPKKESTAKTQQPVKESAAAETEIKVKLAGMPKKTDGGVVFIGTDEKKNEQEFFVSYQTMKSDQKDMWAKLADTLKDKKTMVRFVIVYDGEKNVIERFA